jgi:hypothetical protein
MADTQYAILALVPAIAAGCISYFIDAASALSRIYLAR